MNAAARKARATRRELGRATRTRRRAGRLVATGAPQTARVHLVAAGLSDADAKRFAGAFSRSVVPTGGKAVRVKNPNGKRHGDRHLWFVAKTYDLATFKARLAVYRPKSDPAAAARFETAAFAA